MTVHLVAWLKTLPVSDATAAALAALSIEPSWDSTGWVWHHAQVDTVLTYLRTDGMIGNVVLSRADDRPHRVGDAIGVMLRSHLRNRPHSTVGTWQSLRLVPRTFGNTDAGVWYQPSTGRRMLTAIAGMGEYVHVWLGDGAAWQAGPNECPGHDWVCEGMFVVR